MPGGYKVWLGSIETDGTRLVSDGADNKSKFWLPLPLYVCAPPLRPQPPRSAPTPRYVMGQWGNWAVGKGAMG